MSKYDKNNDNDRHTGRCLLSHPALDVGGNCVLYGGSCSSPVVKDADVYIGFDSGMVLTDRSFPWEPGHEVYLRIIDGAAPKNDMIGHYKKLVEWTSLQLAHGAKVHVGCIGGHGRTGMFLAALVAHRVTLGIEIPGGDDPIKYVREHYCKKSVETKEQVDFLVVEFGCKTAEPSKQRTPPGNSNWWGPSSSAGISVVGKHWPTWPTEGQKVKRIESGTPSRSKPTIWSDKVTVRNLS